MRVVPYLSAFPQRVIDRFLSIVDQTQDSKSCWLWPRSVGSHGYGQMGWQEGDRLVASTVHRIAWVAAGNILPDDMTVDHECRTRACVNPSHLRLLTNEENGRDNGNARKTHCPSGHPYDEANTRRTKKGHRKCRACDRTRVRF